MNNKEILEKAIQKAIDGGWDELKLKDCTVLPASDWILDGSITVWNSYLKDRLYIPYPCILFDPLFAKALWGDSDDENPNLVSYPAHRAWEEPDTILYWQYHLQMMVVSDDPISYLGENI